MSATNASLRSALFVPCLTGAVFADDVEAQRRLLARAGFPAAATLPAFCCGQPAATAGDREGASEMGRTWAEMAAGYDAVFVASATCCGHLRQEGAATDRIRYAPEVWVETIRARSSQSRIPIYLHRPCHDVWDDVQFAAYARWVGETANVEVIARPYRDPCCGFGGVFSTLFDKTAASMMAHRIGAIAGAGAGVVVSAEPGCLSHFAAHAGGLTVLPLATFLVSRGIA
jgi:L-lactate dehydrogenase complex protein LldE